jgi:hypothetical protein
LFTICSIVLHLLADVKVRGGSVARPCRISIPTSRDVRRIHVVLILLRLVAGEALLGGVGHRRLLGVAAFEELNLTP